MILENSIGLSQRDCNCITTEKQENWSDLNVSKSGLYVDNTEFTVNLKDEIFTDCDSSGIWGTLNTSRTEGITTLNTFLLPEIAKYQSKKFGNITDTFGQKESTSININSLYGDFLGFSISPRSPRSTVLNIKSVSLAIAESGTYNVKFLKVNPNTLESTEIGNIDVTGGSNTLTTASVTWSYRFTGNETLYIGYNRSSGFPLNTKVYCPTCTGQTPEYAKHLLVKGIDATSESTIATDYKENSLTHGLFVEFDYQCDYLEWLDDKDGTYWSKSPFARLYSKLAQMLSCQHFNNHILQSDVSYYTLVEGQRLIDINNEIQEIVSDLVPQLAMKLPNDFSDCFNCKPKHNLQIRNLTT